MPKGEFVPSFEPTHVTGVDRGTQTCPICKYPTIPGAQVWVSGDEDANVGKLAADLETKISALGLKKFRTFVVFVKPKDTSTADFSKKLEKISEDYKLKNVALVYVSPNDSAIQDYGIDLSSGRVKNTVMVYKGRRIIDNFVNLKADDKGINELNKAVKQAVSAAK
ncbi:MAG: hypothetical protein JSS72_02905 [Armatimonadetes bacterium]|nr:hypothetical protein [Armatimonadota bacterium]